MHFLSFYTIKTIDIMDGSYEITWVSDITSHKTHSILPRAMCFTMSRPANHAICSYIDSSVYASGRIRRCLFIDYIIIILNPLTRK